MATARAGYTGYTALLFLVRACVRIPDGRAIDVGARIEALTRDLAVMQRARLAALRGD